MTTTETPTFKPRPDGVVECPQCGEHDAWQADYDQAVRQGVTLSARSLDDIEVIDYDGCESTYDDGSSENTRYWCQACDFVLWESGAGAAERDSAALDRMHAALTGIEWDAGTIEIVAEILESTGRKIAGPGELDDDEDEHRDRAEERYNDALLHPADELDEFTMGPGYTRAARLADEAEAEPWSETRPAPPYVGRYCDLCSAPATTVLPLAALEGGHTWRCAEHTP